MQLSGAYGGRALRRTPMAAAGSTKAMALVKRTLVLSPVASPKTPPGSPPRGCSWPPTAWPFKDWSRARSPATSCLPQPHSCSTSATAVCLFCPQNSLSNSLKTCYKYLDQTSRSFAAVIQALDGDIRLVESPDWGGLLFQDPLSHCSYLDTPLRIMGSLLWLRQDYLPPLLPPVCLLANALPGTWPSTSVLLGQPFQRRGWGSHVDYLLLVLAPVPVSEQARHFSWLLSPYISSILSLKKYLLCALHQV